MLIFIERRILYLHFLIKRI